MTTTTTKKSLTDIFRSCLDILRDNEHLTGDKALRPLGYFLQLRLLESQFGRTIDIDNFPYDFSEYEFPERQRAEVLKLVRFSYLATVKEDNLVNNMQYLWNDVLSVHPATKNVFLKGRSFELKRQTTYKKIIDKLASVDFSSIEEDILGEAYEEVVKDIMIGKTLGQFFTPPKVKEMMVNLINQRLYPDGTTESIFDPAMGTGGFLITCLRNLIQKSKVSGVKLNWEFLRKNSIISGRECEPDTYQLAVSNMLISSGNMFFLEQGDSIRDPITAKYDIVMANPPFGIKGLEYDEITSPLRNEYLPIRSKSSTPLFLQAIIYMLKVNGRCAVVLPDGQDLFSKSKSLVAVREYLMKTCELKEVIYLPAGMFTHTTIKTCVFYFYKRKEGNEVLDLKIKHSDGKETDRSYVFTKAHQTEKVVFSEFDGTTKRFIAEVDIEQLEKNQYSLNASEYLRHNENVKIGGGVCGGVGDCVVKTLGEVCEFLSGKKRNASEAIPNGKYKFITCSIQGYSYLNEYDFEDKALIINSINGSGRCMVYCAEKYSTTNNNFHFKIKNKEVLTEYVYHYLYQNIYLLEDGFIGANQKKISKDYISNIKIPIPSLEKQKEIVDRLDFILEQCNTASHLKIKHLVKLNELRFQTSAVFGAHVKTLGEVCKIDFGTRIVKSNNIGGEYPVFGSGRATFSTTTFNRENYNVLIGRFALSAECVRLMNEKIFLNDSGLSVKPTDTRQLLHKYIGYYLQINQAVVYACARGTAQKNLDMDKFRAIQIPIPSLEQQREIVEFCEANDRLIKQLEKEIEQNEKFAKTIIQDAFAGLESADETKKRKHGDL
jgi:type I restriction-modification system DNA methylase subunit/restriction endonuclease S subunit